MSTLSKDLQKTESSVKYSETPSTVEPSVDLKSSGDSPKTSCEDSDIGYIPLDNDTYKESGKHDMNLQTRCDTGSNMQRPYSFDNMDGHSSKNVKKVSSKGSSEIKHRSCIKVDSKRNGFAYARNPITGDGLHGDGVGGWKPMTRKNREGNPLTGEGYKPGQQDYIGPINMKDAHESININRDGRTHVPPGGYSSGLW